MNPTDSSDRLPNDLSAADRELEAALLGLAPAAVRLDAPAALFAAGHAAGLASARRSDRRSLIGWRSAAALLAVVTTISIAANLRQMSGRQQLLAREMQSSPVTAPSQNPDPPSRQELPAPTPPTTTTMPPTTPMPPMPEGGMLALRTAVLADGVDALPRQSFGSSGTPMRIGDLYR